MASDLRVVGSRAKLGPSGGVPVGAVEWSLAVVANPRVTRLVFGDRDEPGYAFSVRASGHVVDLAASFFAGSKSSSVARGDVGQFSAKSRRRLFKRAASVDWEAFGQSVFVTLTYPAVWPGGRRAKRDLDNFHRAFGRCYGSAVGMWKLEFQRRGAPHFHLALVCPGDVRDIRAWVASTWFRIVASGDDRHFLAGTQVVVLAGSPAAYFAGYVGSHRPSKEYQHVVPEGEWSGRFWGAWGLPVPWVEYELSEVQFFQLRRLVSAYGRSRSGRGFRRTGRVQGGWQFVDSSGLLLLSRMVEFVVSQSESCAVGEVVSCGS